MPPLAMSKSQIKRITEQTKLRNDHTEKLYRTIETLRIELFQGRVLGGKLLDSLSKEYPNDRDAFKAFTEWVERPRKEDV